MRKPILVLTITAFVLGGGAIAANAQAPDPHHPGSNVEQESTNPPIPGAPGMQQGNPRAGMVREMSAPQPGRRGWWWLLASTNLLLLALGLRGVLGEEARTESEVAREDWRQMLRSPIAYAIFLLIVLLLMAIAMRLR